MAKCLVCILAQTRAAELTWENFRNNVLTPLDADLALAVAEGNGQTHFHKAAKYVWECPEPGDWGVAFDQICDALGTKSGWRIMLKVKNQWLGGIPDPYEQQPGSAGILLFFRWFLLHNLLIHDVLSKYDRFVVTRSDFFYVCPHPPLEILVKDKIWIPGGEQYGGITDRHLVVSKSDVQIALGVYEDIFYKPDELFEEMKCRQDWNLERYLDYQFQKRGIRSRCNFFPYVMYTVRHPQETSRWTMGKYNPEVKQIVKYPSELLLARRWAVEFNRVKDWRLVDFERAFAAPPC